VHIKTPFRNIRKELRRQAAALLLCFSLTASLLSVDLSFSKYVLETTVHTISLTSSDTVVTGIGAISGLTEVGQQLTAGTVTPTGATCAYQWQSCATTNGTYTDISGATSATYTLQSSDINCYIKVSVTGTGDYTGSAVSAYAGPVTPSSDITAISEIVGTAQAGQTLTAGQLTPNDATCDYQWQSCDTPDGSYTAIDGATANTYVLDSTDIGFYIRIVAAGTGIYAGSSATSAYIGPVAAYPLTGIGAIGGIAEASQTLTAGALSPEGATANYQWQRCDTSEGTYENIDGATASTYTVSDLDVNYYVRVTATGTGLYSGTVASAATGPVAAEPEGLEAMELSSVTSESPEAEAETDLAADFTISGIEPITGISQTGQVLTAGTMTPAEATVTYQWQRCDTADGDYTDIEGAVVSTYTLLDTDINYFFRVIAAGSELYEGSAASTPVGPVTSRQVLSIEPITGMCEIGQVLTAGAVTPADAAVTYQWQRCDTADGEYIDIEGAAASTYTLLDTDIDFYLKLKVTGFEEYTGEAISSIIGPVAAVVSAVGETESVPESVPESEPVPLPESVPEPIVITEIESIIGTAQVGQMLTAGAVTPSDITVDYQWQRSETIDGTYSDIEGAGEGTYTISADDYNYYIRVAAVVSGSDAGAVTSAPLGPVEAAPVSLSILSVEAPAAGGIPQSAHIETNEYTATITWEPVSETFDSAVVYTATVTVIAHNGYTSTGVAADFFTVTGAISTTYDSGVVTVVFPPAM
jgi:hypothetical protein